MSIFYVRVELHQPDEGHPPDYDKLHRRMADKGFARALMAPDGTYRALPSGTYRINSGSMLSTFNTARKIAFKVAYEDAAAVGAAMREPEVLLTRGGGRYRLTTIEKPEYDRLSLRARAAALRLKFRALAERSVSRQR